MRRQVKNVFLSLGIGLLLLLGMFYFLDKGIVYAKTSPNSSEEIQAGLTYLANQQLPDGGITGFSGVSDPDTTARTILAYLVAGEPITKPVSADGHSMLDYLATQAISFTHDTTGTLFPGRAGIVLSAVSAAGADPTSFGGMDLVKELEASYNLDTDTYSTTAKAEFSSGQASDQSQAWAILGLSLAGRAIPGAAVKYLTQSQADDGGWSGGDPDTSALVVTSLLASQKITNQNPAIHKAIGFFQATQLQSGGWKPSWDTDPLNADSTGWVIQALVSAGEDVLGQSWSTKDANPLDALASLQKPDGSIGGQFANSYSTAEAILGLSGIPVSSMGMPAAGYRAGLAIFYGSDNFFTKCISFTEDTLTGLNLLKASGLTIETATNPSQGTAVCKINDTGSPSSDCFGSMPDYWSYWQMGHDGFEYSTTGADQAQVTDGGLNAWSWGTGSPPPPITFQNICEGVAFVLPTSLPPSPAPTVTSAPVATATLIPATPTSQPTPTTAPAQSSTGNYLVYAIIVVGLGALILFFFRSRSK